MSKHKTVRQRVPFHWQKGQTFLFYSGFQLIGGGPPTPGRAIYFAQSTDSNVDLIPKHPHRNTPRIMFDQIAGPPGPSQVGTQN